MMMMMIKSTGQKKKDYPKTTKNRHDYITANGRNSQRHGINRWSSPKSRSILIARPEDVIILLMHRGSSHTNSPSQSCFQSCVERKGLFKTKSQTHWRTSYGRRKKMILTVGSKIPKRKGKRKRSIHHVIVGVAVHVP